MALAAAQSVWPAGRKVVHFGRHAHKLQLVKGTQQVVVDADDKVFDQHEHVSPACLILLPGLCLPPHQYLHYVGRMLSIL